MNVEQRIGQLTDDPHVTSVVVERTPDHRNNPGWFVRVYRNVPVHVVIGTGYALSDAFDDLERSLSE